VSCGAALGSRTPDLRITSAPGRHDQGYYLRIYVTAIRAGRLHRHLSTTIGSTDGSTPKINRTTHSEASAVPASRPPAAPLASRVEGRAGEGRQLLWQDGTTIEPPWSERTRTTRSRSHARGDTI
jgi:hypothetical protein